jgi:transposase
MEMLRLLKVAKDSAVKARTQAINQLKAVLVGADPQLREALAGLGRAPLIRRGAELREPITTSSDLAATVVYTLRLLAGRIQHLTGEIADLTGRITEILTAHAPQLLQRRGVGPDSAAALLITAGDNRNGSPTRPVSPRCAPPAPSRHPQERPTGVDSTGAATGRPTPPSTAAR